MADNIFGNLAPTNQDFDTGWHTLGALGEVSQAVSLVGGRAWFPNPLPANFLWLVFNASTQQILAQANLLTAVASPTLGAWNDFSSAAFQAPGNVALNVPFVVAIATNGDFVYRTAFTYPHPPGSPLVWAVEGRVHNGGTGPVFPEGADPANAFLADVLVEAGSPPPTGTPAVWRAGAPEQKWATGVPERKWQARPAEAKWAVGQAEGV